MIYLQNKNKYKKLYKLENNLSMEKLAFCSHIFQLLIILFDKTKKTEDVKT